MVWNAIETVLPVFLLIALGRLLCLRGYFPVGTATALSRLVFYVAAPVLIFRSLASSPLSVTLDPRGFVVVACISALTVASALVLSRHMPARRRGVVAQGAFRSNTVMIGLSIATYALGDEALGPAAALVGVTVITYNLLAVLALTIPNENGASPLSSLRTTVYDVLRNPLIVASVLGILCALIQVPLATSLDRSLELVGRMTIPLALLVVGADLDVRYVRSDLAVSSLVATCKLVLYPGAIALTLALFGTPVEQIALPVLITASPTAVISVVMAREMHGDERLATSIVVTSTLGAAVTLPLWLMLLTNG